MDAIRRTTWRGWWPRARVNSPVICPIPSELVCKNSIPRWLQRNFNQTKNMVRESNAKKGISMTKTLKNVALSLAMLVSVFAAPLHAFEVSGESFPAEFNITSWTSDINGIALTAEGDVGEGYGKVYLSYDFVSSSADKNQGDFSGDIRTINNDGVMVAGTLQGIWKRDGKMVTMYTLDQFSNGDMIYAKGDVDLVKGTMSFTAYPIQ